MTELLTAGTDGHAVPGPRIRRMRFFEKDGFGRPVPDSDVEFFVPESMMNGSEPGPLALKLAAERMGLESV